jgi:hypothetical protein
MRPLAGEPLLQAWELGAHQAFLDRSLTMLRVACPELSFEQLAALPVSQLNLQLLRLRQISLGSTLSGFVPCTHCAARLEFSVPIALLLAELEPLAARHSVQWTDGIADYSLRAASSRDLALAQCESSPELARTSLLERCLTARSTTFSSEMVQVTEEASRTALQKFNELHAAAEITVQLSCPACGRQDSVDLDIARFLWMEVRYAALRLLRDVHELASAHGWDEQSILGMGLQRRNAYLEMLHA